MTSGSRTRIGTNLQCTRQHILHDKSIYRSADVRFVTLGGEFGELVLGTVEGQAGAVRDGPGDLVGELGFEIHPEQADVNYELVTGGIARLETDFLAPVRQHSAVALAALFAGVVLGLRIFGIGAERARLDDNIKKDAEARHHYKDKEERW